jgi:hypothetical protein
MTMAEKTELNPKALPDLLAACEAALHRLKTDGYEPGHYGGDVLGQLERAIEKARKRRANTVKVWVAPDVPPPEVEAVFKKHAPARD